MLEESVAAVASSLLMPASDIVPWYRMRVSVAAFAFACQPHART